MKSKKGFTLIELLAVIIILGVLMIIAIPAVTKYINDSRKNGYVSTAKSIVGGARNLIHSGELDLSDTKTTYYIDGKCINTDNGYKSPYGDFDKAYVVVTATNDGHEYYWTSVDNTGTGVRSIKKVDSLESSDIETNINSDDIVTTVGIDGRDNIVKITGEGCVRSNKEKAKQMMNISTGVISRACPSVSETIYWALQNPDLNDNYQKLVLSDSPVTGGESGSFPGNTEFDNFNNYAPWNHFTGYINNIEVIGTVVPGSLTLFFNGISHDASSFSADLRNLEVCNVTNMERLFSNSAYYSTTINLDLRGWDTSNVTNMSYMFDFFGGNATSITINGLEDLDTKNVTNMNYIFDEFNKYGLANISLNLSNWDVSNVENANNMFGYFGYNAASIDMNIKNMNFSKLTDMTGMFVETGRYSQNITLDLSGWNTSNVTRLDSMFATVGEYSQSVNINLSGWDTSKVTSMGIVFAYLGNGENISSIYLNISDWDFSSVEDMYGMFKSFGGNAQTFSVIIPRTNGNGINNTTNRLYGIDTSTYAEAPSGKQFTLAS